jgi:hypothetical protein
MSSKNLIFTILGILIIGSLFFLIRDRITGYQVMSTRVVISMPVPNQCNMTFEQGWNLVSFPCIAEDIDINLFTENTTLQYVSFRGFDANDGSDPWKSYNPSLPSWAVQDNMLSRKAGYWVYVESQQHVVINSSLATPSIISFFSGWNLIGYPSKATRLSNDTFSPLEPNFEYVYMYNASDPVDKWKLYKVNSSLPGTITLNYTVPNYGYWIYMTAPDSLFIT